MADDLCEQVSAVVGVDVFGSPGLYTPQGASAVACTVERLEDLDRDFDTGSTERDFILIRLMVPKATVPVAKMLGQAGTGDTFVFDDDATVWHARQIVDSSKGYHLIVFSDSVGPIEGI